MRYNTLNDIQAVPLGAKCLVVFRLVGAAISWLFLWGLTTVVVELVVSQT